MALVTYILLSTLLAGLRGAFRPELLGYTATVAICVTLLEIIIIRTGTFLLAITSSSQLLAVAFPLYFIYRHWRNLDQLDHLPVLLQCQRLLPAQELEICLASRSGRSRHGCRRQRSCWIYRGEGTEEQEDAVFVRVQLRGSIWFHVVVEQGVKEDEAETIMHEPDLLGERRRISLRVDIS
jgi:hypothetical protein